MKFVEFMPGMVITAGPYKVQEAEVLQFAKSYDPQWFHSDPVAATKGRFGGLIASVWHTCGIAVRLIADIALTVPATVLEARVARSQPGMGILRWRWQMRNALDVAVLDLEATSLFDLSQ